MRTLIIDNYKATKRIRTLLTVLMLFSAWIVRAGTVDDVVTVWTKDGGCVSYELATRPKVTFGEGVIHFESSEVTVDFPLVELDKFTFGSSEGNAIALPTVQTKGYFRILGNNFTARNLTPNTAIVISSLSGELIVHGVTDESGCAELEIPSAPMSVYIVKTAKSTFKFIKK